MTKPGPKQGVGNSNVTGDLHNAEKVACEYPEQTEFRETGSIHFIRVVTYPDFYLWMRLCSGGWASLPQKL